MRYASEPPDLPEGAPATDKRKVLAWRLGCAMPLLLLFAAGVHVWNFNTKRTRAVAEVMGLPVSAVHPWYNYWVITDGRFRLQPPAGKLIGEVVADETGQHLQYIHYAPAAAPKAAVAPDGKVLRGASAAGIVSHYWRVPLSEIWVHPEETHERKYHTIVVDVISPWMRFEVYFNEDRLSTVQLRDPLP